MSSHEPPSANPTWYDILGVAQDAGPDEIKAAWRSATDKFEPGSGTSQFRLFNEAADVLLHRERRAAYDAQLAGTEPEVEPVDLAKPEPEAVEAPEAAPAVEPITDDQLIAVQLSGVTRFVRRSEVRHVEAYGDYVRLHLPSGSHLLRVPLSTLESQWQDAGFVRVHRRHLVATEHIEELLTDDGRMSVRVGGTVLPVSRRSHRRLRELVRSACPPTDREAPDG